jgi:hypothetical protein
MATECGGQKGDNCGDGDIYIPPTPPPTPTQKQTFIPTSTSGMPSSTPTPNSTLVAALTTTPTPGGPQRLFCQAATSTPNPILCQGPTRTKTPMPTQSEAEALSDIVSGIEEFQQGVPATWGQQVPFFLKQFPRIEFVDNFWNYMDAAKRIIYDIWR